MTYVIVITDATASFEDAENLDVQQLKEDGVPLIWPEDVAHELEIDVEELYSIVGPDSLHADVLLRIYTIAFHLGKFCAVKEPKRSQIFILGNKLFMTVSPMATVAYVGIGDPTVSKTLLPKTLNVPHLDKTEARKLMEAPLGHLAVSRILSMMFGVGFSQ